MYEAIIPKSILLSVLQNQTNTSKYTNENDTSLSFVGSVSDTGIYECRAANQGGNVTQELVLLIYGIMILLIL